MAEVMSGAAQDEIRCKLAVVSASVTPEEVTDRTGVPPTDARHRGDRTRRGVGPKYGVPEHQWFWKPDGAVALTLDAQLDAIWMALGSRADAFRSLESETEVVVDILIEHYGDDLLLGWVMAARHVSMAAAFGALISVDEYNYTEPH